MSTNDGGALPHDNDAVKRGQRELAALARQYQTAGFISGMRILSLEEVAHQRESLKAAEAALGQSLHYLNKVHTVMPSAYSVATHPALLDIVEALMGPDILLYNATFIIEEPGDSAFVSWHQDLTYWGFDGTDQVSAWVALSVADALSGCMEMVPGSHRNGIHPHITSDDPNNILLQSQSLSDPNIAPGEVCELAPGEVSLHHGWTIHRSSPNRSADRRIGLNIQYIRPSMRQLKANVDTALLVRGTDQYGHFEPDVPATDWGLEIAAQRLADCSAQYRAIAGRSTPHRTDTL